jgi:methyl-accepting chemotaxis protein
MNINNLKIGTKILGGFALVALITLIVGIIGFVGVNRVSSSFHDVVDEQLPSIEALMQIETGFENLRGAHRTLLNPNLSREDKARQFRNIANARERYGKAIQRYELLEQSSEEQVLWREFNQKVLVWRNANVEFEKYMDDLARIDIHNPMGFLKDLETFQGDHYALQVNISNTIRSGRVFEGGDDHTACRLGRWLPTITTQNPAVLNAINGLREPHRQFHEAVHSIKRLVNAGNRNEAWVVYERVMLPSAERVFANFAIAIAEAQRAVDIFLQAEKINMNEARLAQEDTYVTLERLINLNEGFVNQSVADGDRAVSASSAMVIGGIIVGLALALLLGIVISRMISAPLIKGVNFAQQIAQGNLTAELDNEIVQRSDEVGQLGSAMQNMVEKLKDVIGSVILGSDNIASASMQMSSGSQQVSQGASEQASSAEEVSSSMEQMAANIQQNTDNAQEADKISTKVSEGVQKVGAAAAESLQSIKNIAEKISIINDIAFQTNILALNAAVEAARAGEQGRGFAVVAAEVRKLAERSKVAADEIVALSSRSVNVTETAAELMGDLIPEIERTAKLVQEIAAASMEQTSGADQVNTAIQQLNQITQQNAAASEEMATSAEELNSQADQLKEIIGYFSIDHVKTKSQRAQKDKTPFVEVRRSSQKVYETPKGKGVTLKMSDGFKDINTKGKSGYHSDSDFENF